MAHSRRCSTARAASRCGYARTLPHPRGAVDLEALASLAVDGVRLPKSEDPSQVAEVGTALRRPIHLILESALGVENALELARCSEWVHGIALGEADLLADLGGLDASALGYSRGRVVSAARAAGLGAPVMSVWTDLQDEDGLRSDCLAARAAGFFGRAVVHPKQVPVVNAAFLPSDDEIAAAERAVAAMHRRTRPARVPRSISPADSSTRPSSPAPTASWPSPATP